MTASGSGQPTMRRLRKQRLACTLAAVATPVALAAAMPAAHIAASASPAPASAALAALHSTAPTAVTLVTGDRILMTTGPSGRVSVTSQQALRADGARPMIEVTSLGKQGRAPTMYALPTDASALIAAGRVDKNLFNVGYLAAAEDAATGRSTVPVVIRYGGRLSAGELAARAGNLPGASVRAVLPGSNAAEVTLDPRKAARFWAVLTGGHTPVFRPAPRPGAPAPSLALAGGVTRIWLAGHQSVSQPGQRADLPTYTVTVTIYGRANPGPAEDWCGSGFETVCPAGPLVLMGVAGGGVDNVYEDLFFRCADQNPCDTIQAHVQVPAGVYATTGGFGWFQSDSRANVFDLVDPQFVVAGPTQIAFHLDDARPVRISTPRPSQTAQNGFGDQRGLPDGLSASSFTWANYGAGDVWAAPSGQPVTIGTFNLQTTFDLVQPPVAMTVTAPQQLALDPFYPTYSSHGWISSVNPGSPESAIRFSGQQTLPLVDVGTGSAADFAGRDVRGKLVLMRMQDSDVIAGCVAVSEQLQNALDAGAAGVVLDPFFPPSGGDSGFVCPVPIVPDWWFDFATGLSLPVVQIPYVAIPHSQATSLRQLMSRGPVSITVTDNGQAHYAYHLKVEESGQVPASLNHDLTSRQLTTVTANYHADSPQPWGVGDSSVFSAFAGDDHVVAGAQDSLGAPLSRQEYMLAAPDMMQWLDTDSAPDAAAQFTTATEFHIFGERGGSETWNWFEPPVGLGDRVAPEDVFQALPGIINGSSFSDFCVSCRQGDVFWPLFAGVPGAAPGQIDGGLIFDSSNVDQIHLYSGGQEIPPNLDLGIVTYQLPAAQARFRLTVNDANTQNAWDFTSATPASSQVPDGSICLGTLFGSSDPCQPVPLVFLRYDAGLSLANTVAAPGAHQIQITAYHEAASAPAITGLQAWISTDGGAVWHPAAAVTARGGGAYTVTYTLPRVSATNGTVSLKIQAQDAGGNDVTQVIQDAFGLSAK